jgi:hypothetical protein
MNKKIKFNLKTSADENTVDNRNTLGEMLQKSPIPTNEIGANLPLYMERMHLSRMLLIHDLYKNILSVPGSVFEFGIRWGASMAMFNNFRGMYEPYNYSRKIVGFDTFEGFVGTSEKDGVQNSEGNYSVSGSYELHLSEILKVHENMSPLPHIKKWDIIKGDASITLAKYLKDKPETIISLAYFDFDIYKPTKDCLQLVMKNVTKGSIIVFDELNSEIFPGETEAFKEVIGSYNVKLKRDINNPLVAWFVVD